MGYRKQVGSHAFFSRDDFWYNGTQLPFDHEEPYTGIKDRKGRKLFVGDVVRHGADGQAKTLRIADIQQGAVRLICHITERPLANDAPLSILAAGQFIGIV